MDQLHYAHLLLCPSVSSCALSVFGGSELFRFLFYLVSAVWFIPSRHPSSRQTSLLLSTDRLYNISAIIIDNSLSEPSRGGPFGAHDFHLSHTTPRLLHAAGFPSPPNYLRVLTGSEKVQVGLQQIAEVAITVSWPLIPTGFVAVGNNQNGSGRVLQHVDHIANVILRMNYRDREALG